jgi:hypothetical protein
MHVLLLYEKTGGVGQTVPTGVSTTSGVTPYKGTAHMLCNNPLLLLIDAGQFFLATQWPRILLRLSQYRWTDLTSFFPESGLAFLLTVSETLHTNCTVHSM